MLNIFRRFLFPSKQQPGNVLYGFEDAFENSAIGMAFVSFEGQWLRVNNSFAKIVGYTVEELLKKKFQDITHPEDLQRDIEYINDMLKGKFEHYQLQKRYISKTGKVVPVILSVSFVRNPDLTPKHLLTQIVDLSEFERLRQQTTQIQSQLEQVFERMSEAFSYQRIIVDDQGNPVDFEFLLVNKALEDLVGLNKEELIGKRFSILPYKSEKRLKELIQKGGRAALQGEDFTDEFLYETKQKWFRIHFFPSTKNEFSMILTDITDRKLTEMKMHEQIQELTKVNDIMANREIRIAELKEELKKHETLTKL
ncbi:MAG: hypothetical protein BroJett025_08700 [Patescibacteria group bacterium]|nr:MAG: hypothetical protein BroJett025_08700 [Patescibacteria group bacterium]